MSEQVLIETRGLTKHFGDVTAVENLSLSIQRGGITGFLGLNGAGKSTTIRMLLGLLTPDSGEISLFGRKDGAGRRQALGRIGALVDSPAFYGNLSGRKNLSELAALSGGGSTEEVDRALRQVGLVDAADRRANHYSLGMKQRLAVALALVGQPELVILDEPTNGLDPNGIMEMRRLIRKLNREDGVTFLISSHLIHEIELICDRVIIIERGKLILEDRLANLSPRLGGRFELKTADTESLSQAKAIIAGSDLFELKPEDANPSEAATNSLRFRAAAEDLPTLHRQLLDAQINLLTLAEVRITLEEFFLSQSTELEEGTLS